MEIITRPKKWGNSIGVVIPKEAIESGKITLRDELVLHVEKKSDKEKVALMKEGYLEMAEELKNVNKEWEIVDIEEWE